MINIIDKSCIHEGCKIRPSYNIEGEKGAIYCSVHKKDKMIDVKSKTCIYQGCKTIPSYNIEGKKGALYCSVHKKDKMIDVKSKICIHEGCKTVPSYNNEGEKGALYCSAHKLDGMIDIKNATCKTKYCNTHVQKKYDGYCLYCYMNLFPDKPVTRNYKTKEYTVVEFVKSRFPDKTWIADKIIQAGCSKRRPDLLLDLGYQIIIVEIDENQHIDYDCSCENKRLMELSQDVGHRPIIFIRFNPDEYLEKSDKVSSCWGINGNGLCVIKKSKKNEWKQRLNSLETQIKYWIDSNNKTEKTLEIIQLYYDS
jgi:hypothetical protein